MTIFSSPGPHVAQPTSGTYTGPSGTFPFDLVYGQCCGLPAVLSISLPLASPSTSLPCTLDPVTGQCMSLTLADADPSREGGQSGQSCNNGPINGTIAGNVTVSAPQYCRYTSPCEITGNLTIDGGSVYLDCALDGNLTENGGILVLGPSASVGGNVLISQASSFTLGQPGTPMNPTALIRGNLVIQNLPSTVPQRARSAAPMSWAICWRKATPAPSPSGGTAVAATWLRVLFRYSIIPRQPWSPSTRSPVICSARVTTLFRNRARTQPTASPRRHAPNDRKRCAASGQSSFNR